MKSFKVEWTIVQQHMVKINMDFESEFNLAMSYKNKGDYETALSIMLKILEFKEDAPLLWVTGMILRELGRFSDAVEIFRKATLLDPTAKKPSLGLFHSLWDSGREDEAIYEMNRFLSVSTCEDYKAIRAELNEYEDLPKQSRSGSRQTMQGDE
ncbi:MAG: hypothetical protein Tsb009_22460 [Planctomycetaceae bacterium]